MDEKFRSLERELVNIRSAIEKLTERWSRDVDTLEKRVADLESFVRVVKYAGSLLIMVVMAIVVAWLRGLLGV